MPFAEFFRVEARTLSPALVCAFAAALGFYPGSTAWLPAFLAADLCAACAIAYFLTPSPRSSTNAPTESWEGRRKAILFFALALGFMLGAHCAQREAALRQAQELSLPSDLYPAWAEGVLAEDSSPLKAGLKSYLVDVRRLGFLPRPAMLAAFVPRSLEIEYREDFPRLRILLRQGPALDQGCLLRLSLLPSKPGARTFMAAGQGIAVLEEASAFSAARSALRSFCRTALSRIGTRSAGLLEALILGIRDNLFLGEAEAFKAAGCSHILALSGDHLSILACVAIASLRPMFGPLPAKLGGALLAGLFMWIAGAAPSLLRSVLMVWFSAISFALDRKLDWLSSLSLCFLLTTAADPISSRSLSFTLSYLAVFGLASLGPRLVFVLGRWLPPFITEALSASLAAQFAVIPLLVFTFGCIQLLGFLASILASPFVAAMMWWGLGAGFLSAIFPALAGLACPVSDFLYDCLMGIMKLAAGIPQLQLPSPTPACLLCLAIALIGALVYARPYAEYRRSLTRL